MTRYKKPEVDLRLKYRKTLELGIVLALAVLLIFFQVSPTIDMIPDEVKAKDVEIMVEDIPQTEQLQKAPPPPRPSIPIPTESETVPEDLTIEATDLDLSDLAVPPPPPPPDEDEYSSYVFIPYDEPPVPVGGMAAILANLKYPEIARRTGLEARVVVGVLINEKGKCVKTQILKGSGSTLGFEEAAQAAVMAVAWKPAKQRDNPVKVWVSIPVNFKLSKSESS